MFAVEKTSADLKKAQSYIRTEGRLPGHDNEGRQRLSNTIQTVRRDQNLHCARTPRITITVNLLEGSGVIAMQYRFFLASGRNFAFGHCLPRGALFGSFCGLCWLTNVVAPDKVVRLLDVHFYTTSLLPSELIVGWQKSVVFPKDGLKEG